MLSFVHGGDIYDVVKEAGSGSLLDLSVSLNPLGMPEGLKEILISSVSCASNYPEPGNKTLSMMAGEVFGISPAEIVFGNGASELIMALTRLFLRKKALLAVPCFTGYIYALKNVCPDCEIVYYNLNEENDFRLDPGIVGAIERERPDIIFLTNPNNPNGALIEKSLLSEIVSICEKAGTHLVIDECFLPFTGRDESDSYLTRLPGKKNLTVLRAFTKTFSIPGVRIGYCTTDEKTAELLQSNLPEWNMSVIAQEAGRYCLKNLSYETKANSLIKEERAYLSNSLRDLGFTVFPSDCNFLLFKTGDREPEPSPASILIRNCSNIPGLSKGYYRIGIKKHEDNERFIKALR